MLNELFLKAQKQKHQIDQELTQFTSLKQAFDSDYNQEYRKHQAQLDIKKLELSKQAENLNAILEAIQSESLSVAQKMKLTNMKQISKEIEIQIQQVYKQKQQKLKEERDKISILGGNRTSTQSDTVGLLVDQQNSLTNSQKLVEESMQMGEDVLLSFKRQNDNLKVLIWIHQNIQSKVNGIIGDMGFSQGLIKLIGSRDVQDKRILIILTTLLIIFIGSLYYVFK